jgi:ABC-type polysaccharide/polyol phosphate transport system ATPase subunit
MTDLAIRCQGIGKSYTLGVSLSLQQTIRMLRGKGSVVERFEALRDVTFDVEAGSFFGIVGHNGSGKSTLTQVMSGIAVPTTGEVQIWGRILPLLEVGAGFNEELTGRENIYLQGTILGVKTPEIEAALPGIVDFAGVIRHIDTPMKRYSSGMKARLSFATAIGLPADIYVFDEVLAVVDDDFRNRCVVKMREMHANGCTIILMSHDLNLIREVCKTGLWLNRGQVMRVGPMDEVADAYAQHTSEMA